MTSTNGTTTSHKKQKDKHLPNSTMASEPNPLLLDFPRFLANEITDAELRDPINRAHAAFKGIRVIGKILFASEVEKQANKGEWSLPSIDQEGLFQALLVLADVGFHDVEDLGDYIVGMPQEGGA